MSPADKAGSALRQKVVLVQAGHLAPREPGFESGTGTAGEVDLVRHVRDALVARLNADGRFHAVAMPGAIPRGFRCDAALFLHADGSGSPQASGFSFGFPPGYSVNAKLANLIAQEFNRLPGHPPHHRDNYTRDEEGYYGFGLVDSAGPEVLVEHGFLTNPKERAWLTSHIPELAEAEYRALLRYFGYVEKQQAPAWYDKYGPRSKPAWFFAALRDYAQRVAP